MAYRDENGRITIDAQAANKDVKRLQQAVEVLKSSRAAIDTLSKEYYMQGNVAAAIILKAEETKKNLTKMINKLEETINFIKKTVHHYEVLDEQIKQAIQAAANAAEAAAKAAAVNANNTGSASSGSGRHDNVPAPKPTSSSKTESKPDLGDVLEDFGDMVGGILGGVFGKKVGGGQMAKIKVEVTALRNNSQALEQHIAQMDALNTRLNTLLARIESSWEGDSSRAYLNMMRRYAAQAATMSKVLTEFQSYVKNAADTFESVDKKAANRINSSF